MLKNLAVTACAIMILFGGLSPQTMAVPKADGRGLSSGKEEPADRGESLTPPDPGEETDGGRSDNEQVKPDDIREETPLSFALRIAEPSESGFYRDGQTVMVELVLQNPQALYSGEIPWGEPDYDENNDGYGIKTCNVDLLFDPVLLHAFDDDGNRFTQRVPILDLDDFIFSTYRFIFPEEGRLSFSLPIDGGFIFENHMQSEQVKGVLFGREFLIKAPEQTETESIFEADSAALSILNGLGEWPASCSPSPELKIDTLPPRIALEPAPDGEIFWDEVTV